ncbi:type VII secretion-associated serine protease mycosin [Salinispora sp. H7-4]|uniref:type VII secretion-associated serine protease mycosin n=1 Tax=Salinispora sp. H7-4 TaxID=2748321 RepID=UPI0015D3FCC0|nr:type VII secretion-associated serine protease mycosin [Salinispora sp. H7-4]NYT95267.1 type VII secretion-associated serine protease mycosin [Salinispora sp. H7-4]
MRLARPATTITAATLTAIMALGMPALPAAGADRNDAWYLDALELTEMHKITQGEGITVAVIDSGVDASHPDLKNNVLPGTDVYDDQSKGHKDRDGHGTGMASLIAGHGHGLDGREGVLGVAPKAKILPITVGDASAVRSEIPNAVNWAVDQGADVINLSLHGTSDSAFNRAVERAYQNNVIVVAGVGNRENTAISGLAMHDATLAVAGLDRDGQPSRDASLPDWGTQVIHLAAPAEDLYQATPGGGYATIGGNSGATAIVSGAVALVKSKYPNLSSADLFKRMVETTRDAGEPGRDREYGWGTLDLRAALTGEPDGRTTQTQSPSPLPPSDPALLRARESDPTDNSLQPTLVIAIVVLALGLITVTALLLLRRRRRAATTPTTHTTPQTPTPTSPPIDPTDPTDWQRPN